jgi:hypothetical protein
VHEITWLLYHLSPALSRRAREQDDQVISCTFLTSIKQPYCEAFTCQQALLSRDENIIRV